MGIRKERSIMYEVNDLVVVKHNGKKYVSVITKITHESYFQCIASDGTVFPSVYVGYAVPLRKQFPISEYLKEMETSLPDIGNHMSDKKGNK